jgi:hypothetical protein
MGFLQMGLGSLSSATVSYFNHGRLSPVPMVSIMMISGILALIYLLINSARINKKDFTEPVLDVETQAH